MYEIISKYIMLTQNAFNKTYINKLKSNLESGIYGKLYIPNKEYNSICELLSFLHINITSINGLDSPATITGFIENKDAILKLLTEFKTCFNLKTSIYVKADGEWIIYKLSFEDIKEGFVAITIPFGNVVTEKDNFIYKHGNSYFHNDGVKESVSPVDFYNELTSPWCNTATSFHIETSMFYGNLDYCVCTMSVIIYDGLYVELMGYGENVTKALADCLKNLEDIKQAAWHEEQNNN